MTPYDTTQSHPHCHMVPPGSAQLVASGSRSTRKGVPVKASLSLPGGEPVEPVEPVEPHPARTCANVRVFQGSKNFKTFEFTPCTCLIGRNMSAGRQTPPYLPAPGPPLLSHPLFRVTEGNRTQHTCVLVPFLLFLLPYF